ncbi:magnesium transporter [Actinomyces minihominis]|uniref:magnesium transporter n=1 Tax=Actinomyces minihominis TaxID=2002838 RepID=UPI000C07BB3B|nr:magnesium transporter [Actinomyces minihominis]
MKRNKFASHAPEPRPTIPETLVDVVSLGTPRALSLWLADVDHDLMGNQVDDLTDEQAERLTELLTPASARELLESIDAYQSYTFLKKLPLPVAAGLLDTLDVDEAAQVIEFMDDGDRQSVLRAMEFSRSALVRGLLAWPDDSAASRMRPTLLQVGIDSTMADAVAAARRNPQLLEEGVFVTERTPQGDVGLGWLSHDAMVLARRADLVRDHMVPADRLQQWSVKPLADQERVIHRVRARDSEVVPVMDGKYILGVITMDSVDEILREETTEDVEMMGGSAPLEIPYYQATPLLLWSKRIVWLLVLFLASMYTSNVMQSFEDVLASATALAFFIPLLIGTGGNVGTQITTTLIRAIAADGLRLSDVGAVLWKEFRTGLLVALTMAVAGLVRAWTLGVGWPITITVIISLAAIVMWSSLVASILPLILKRMKLDPAVVSAPMISTIVDGTGLLIYFMVARAIIPGL